MSKVLIIGAGGVGGVVTHKCAEDRDTFSEIVLASRTLSRCEGIQKQVRDMRGREIEIAQVDADDVAQTVALIKRVQPELLINVALPYQDLPLMDACLEAGVDYLDTANYEPPDEAKFEYKWQWDYHERFESAGIMALLGSGFDPGVTNTFCAYAQKKLFDEIDYIDILDCNGGDHGHPFATNFNPEINIREITQRGRYWENGSWVEIDAMSQSRVFDFPAVGERKAYLLYHEELESLVKHIDGLKRIRFWMTFGDEYITHLRVLQNVGMTSIEPLEYEGREIVPIQFLKALLPDPSTLGENYTGKTSIGCLIEGRKNGEPKKVFIYNVCDHQESWKEVRAQAVSYTTGVPTMVGAKMLLTGQWQGKGVFNVEQFDPEPFLDELGRRGLPWHVKEM
ncbi:MAG: saccharopine dehydrogenase family protein [Deltaproteobacteria bacterium]|nr:saccharopine dehydrogenase family protein [Deltaproteobacteria bacterium]NND27025.1 saccharopine dehydrogenase family protein [Myxococcales bacterium]MBT8464568.1 saccharopine dehydrogenase family protein [Deltaproteobacteria bacterium]MBT8483124.1 saccharopine dehydrogenase family protein [Deltaproteobacteria bacterium]NNK05815.1 saccharopine dehydrogenase family protein [Myxococcales bacterium]